ncbi:hypothetical protein F7Q99_39040 [Streptomyces kaniharaensis]|uniref:Uncharacterized protein n=1 Tax=Streptomyces kaniharaensis TaxID=212423 RepID=A0A6N7L513_9ACTN|nr:hypothetical protein [Streptomyces kaniharaensis]MQS18029.1 hypothetical protein [Streptomyces kaniharaensis]
MSDKTCEPDVMGAVGTALGSWLSSVPPTAETVLECLRAAEAGTTGQARAMWGFAALNWEAALNADGGRPSGAELRAVALEYAQFAAREHGAVPGAVR